MYCLFRFTFILACFFVVISGFFPCVFDLEGAQSGSLNGVKENSVGAALTVTPREIDLGDIGPSEGAKSAFILKNAGSGAVEWSVSGPEGWTLMETQKLGGTLRDKPANLRIHVSSLKEVLYEDAGKSRNTYPVQVTLETWNRFVSYQKRLTPGAHREMLILTSNSGTRTIFIRFKLVSAVSEPVINVEPLRVDFGVVRPGEQVAKRVKVTNKGINTLKWGASVQSQQNTDSPAKAGRYISFLNDDIAGSGVYAQPPQLKDVMDISGKWSEQSGYPTGNTVQHILKYRFLGTGISVFFSVAPDGGELTAYVDDKAKNNWECHAGQKERAECMVIEGLTYGPHTLTIVGKGGQVMIEGVGVYGKDVMKGNPGWIGIFPDSGTTNRETDFVNITVNIQQSSPGYYGENIIFASNGGESVVQISLEVSEDNISKSLDVYRYVGSSDYLYTSNPQEDARIIQARGYRKQGIAFRLFSPGTPGTTAFYRWYHPAKKILFYSYDRHGGGRSLKGYTFEGTIGNIGTSRLTNTRELYRWFNPVTGGHFYTTDPNGEGHLKKGYRFEGIAGYVR
jgi:hypothetical protein